MVLGMQKNIYYQYYTIISIDKKAHGISYG